MHKRLVRDIRELCVSSSMNTPWRIAAVCAMVGAAFSLAACSSVPKELPVRLGPSYADSVVAGEEAQLKGAAAEALAHFERAAKSDPSKKQPWLRIAQLQFDARNYGAAITAAQEVVQRDNTDVTAKSIMAVSGLRVSALALDQLREANAVSGGAREEAQLLAKTMRAALGESIFPVAAPAPVEPPPKVGPTRSAKPALRKPVAGTSDTVAAPATPPKGEGAVTPPARPKLPESPRNPFDALKG